MQINIEIVFWKERFFCCFFFYGREPIRLIPKNHIACRLQFQILNMKM
jgi:hypothetical protein